MAMLAVIILTLSLSISALFIGAHLAIAVESVFRRPVNFLAVQRIADPLVVVLGWGSWIGAVFLAIFPPHDSWRGEVLFSLIFGPLGCLARFYLSLYLNGKIASFPLGTFTANIVGTMVLGMAWDLAHASVGGIIGCQVLQGVEDGFCGCLTTISTWVSELTSLRKRHSYIYGTTSVVVGLVAMIAIMGGLKWSEGFSGLMCKP
jgi:protein CrcB